jgi:hypothetical protein
MISDGLTMIIPKSLNIVLKLGDNIVLHGVEHHSHTCIARYGSLYTGHPLLLRNQSKPKLAFSTKKQKWKLLSIRPALWALVTPKIPNNYYSLALLPLLLQLFSKT